MMTSLEAELFPNALDVKTKRAIVCGGRDYADAYALEYLRQAILLYGVTELAHGDARGADQVAKQYSAITGMRAVAYPADWATHGKGAGPIRNRHMLADFKPELVIAFPGGKGTEDMCKIARAAGVKVVRVGTAGAITEDE